MTEQPEYPRIPLPQNRRRALLPVLLTVAAASIALNFIDVRETDSTIPAEVKFVPLDSQIFASSPSVGAVIRNVSAHLERTRVADNPIGEKIDEFANDFLFRNCLDFAGGEAYRAAGLNPLAGFSFAAGGGDGWRSPPSWALISIAVSDQDQAIQTLNSLYDESSHLEVRADGDEAPVAFRLSRENATDGVLCAVDPADQPSRSVIPIGVETTIPLDQSHPTRALSVFIGSRRPENRDGVLNCVAIVASGAETDCTCVNLTSANGDCAFPFRPPLQISDDFQRSTLETAESEEDGAGGERGSSDEKIEIWNRDDSISATFADEHLLVALALEPETVRVKNLLAKALTASDARRRSLVGDDAFVRAVQSFKAHKQSADEGGWLVGQVRQVFEPALASATFAFAADQRSIDAITIAPIDTFGLLALKKILTPSEEVATPPTVNAPLRIAIDDPALGEYARFVDRYWFEGDDEEFIAGENEACGSAEAPVAARGLSEYTGNFAPLFERLMQSNDVGRLELMQVGMFRGVPEVVLIQHGFAEKDADQLVRDIRCQMISSSDLVEYSPGLFESEVYKAEGDEAIEYLPPPFTPEDEDDELGVNAFRLAFLKQDDGTIIYGSDAKAIRRYLSLEPVNAARLARTSAPKVQLSADPERLLGMLRLHPDKDDILEPADLGLDALDQYRALGISVRAERHFSGLTVRLRLSHE